MSLHPGERNRRWGTYSFPPFELSASSRPIRTDQQLAQRLAYSNCVLAFVNFCIQLSLRYCIPMQIKRYWLPLFLACFAFIVPHAAAICPVINYQTDFLNADSVFVGKIISRDEKTDLTSLRVSYSWKGPQWGKQTVRIPALVTDQFKADDNGLYYAQPDTDGVLFVDPCSRTAPLDEASEFTLYLFAHIGMWLVFIFLLRFAFIFTFRYLSQAVAPLLYCLTAATLLSLIVPDYILHAVQLPFFAQLAIAPMLFLILSIAGLMIGMSRKEKLVSVDTFTPFGVALAIFAVCEIVIAVFFQPFTALIAGGTAILIADSWRSGIPFEPAENAIKHRFRSMILILVSFSLMMVAVGIFFQRWMSL